MSMCSSMKTLLLERANVRCTETGEEKPLGAINCKSRKEKLFRADAVQPVLLLWAYVHVLSLWVLVSTSRLGEASQGW